MGDDTKNQIEPIAVMADNAGVMLQVSRASIYRMLETGELERVKLSGRRMTRVSVASIKRLLKPAGIEPER